MKSACDEIAGAFSLGAAIAATVIGLFWFMAHVDRTESDHPITFLPFQPDGVNNSTNNGLVWPNRGQEE
jgi:hypothetical protein